MNTLSSQNASPIPDEIASGGPVNVNAGHKTPETEVLTRQTLENPKGALKNCLGKAKYWQQVESDLPREILNFCHNITDKTLMHDQLVNFAVKCDIPNCWVKRAKEDYPEELEVVVNKVFFEWWDRCNFNVWKKL